MRSLAEILGEITEHGKAQEIRLLDVYVLGPLMLWFAWKAKGVPAWARVALGIAGAGTIYYNARNYRALSR